MTSSILWEIESIPCDTFSDCVKKNLAGEAETVCRVIAPDPAEAI